MTEPIDLKTILNALQSIQGLLQAMKISPKALADLVEDTKQNRGQLLAVYVPAGCMIKVIESAPVTTIATPEKAILLQEAVNLGLKDGTAVVEKYREITPRKTRYTDDNLKEGTLRAEILGRAARDISIYMKDYKQDFKGATANLGLDREFDAALLGEMAEEVQRRMAPLEKANVTVNTSGTMSLRLVADEVNRQMQQFGTSKEFTLNLVCGRYGLNARHKQSISDLVEGLGINVLIPPAGTNAG